MHIIWHLYIYASPVNVKSANKNTLLFAFVSFRNFSGIKDGHLIG